MQIIINLSVLLFLSFGFSISKAELTEKILPSDLNIGSSSFGNSVAIHDDTLVIGAVTADVEGKAEAGLVFIYNWDQINGEWNLQATLSSDLITEYQRFGEVVDIYGSTVIVASSQADVDDENNAGIVWVFELNPDDNWLLKQTITDVTPERFERFGISISIDQNLLAVGEISETNYQRSTVSIFEKNDENIWSLQTIINDPNTFYKNDFGKSVALDGDTLLIGAPKAELDCGDVGTYTCFYLDYGAVFFYQRNDLDPAVWDLISEISDPEPSQRAGFGSSVALKDELAIIGSPSRLGDDGEFQVGGSYIVSKQNESIWGNLIKLNRSVNNQYLRFGESVELSKDKILIGAPGAINEQGASTGAIYIYTQGESEQSWFLESEFIPEDATEGGKFGYSIASSSNDLIVGSPQHVGGIGLVYLTTKDESDIEPYYSYQPNFELVNDQIITHETGIFVGTASGTQLDPVPIWIQEIENTEELSLPDIELVGPIINIGTPSEVLLEGETFMGVSLPIPEGIEAENVSALIGVKKSRLMFQNGESENNVFWIPVYAPYDEESNTRTITVSNLYRDGIFVTLYTENSLPQTIESVLYPPKPHEIVNNVAFAPVCSTAAKLYGCTENDEKMIADELLAAWFEFNSKNFRKPLLRRARMQFDDGYYYLPAISEDYPQWYTGITLNSKSDWYCNQFQLGEAVTMPYNIVFCFDYPLNITVQIQETIWHELFHAIQNKYQIVHERWISEGHAAIAANAPGFRRSSYINVDAKNILDTLNVDRKTNLMTIFETDHKEYYKAQDFWLYLGKTHGLSYEYFREIMEVGSDTDSVNVWLTNFAQPTDLGKEYWGWVKNQAYEKTYTLDGELDDGVCIREKNTTEKYNGERVKFIQFSGETVKEQGTLSPLTAKFINIGFYGLKTDIDSLSVSVSGGNGIQYKIYFDKNDPDYNCKDDGENIDRVFEIKAYEYLGDKELIEVLIANTNYDAGPIAYELKVEEQAQ